MSKSACAAVSTRTPGPPGSAKTWIVPGDGAKVTAIVPWTDNAAVVKADAAGKATNKLEIAVAKGQVTFSVNGKAVHTMPAAPIA